MCCPYCQAGLWSSGQVSAVLKAVALMAGVR